MDGARICDSLWSVIMRSTTASWASCFSKNQLSGLIKSNIQSIRARTNFKTEVSSKQTSAFTFIFSSWQLLYDEQRLDVELGVGLIADLKELHSFYCKHQTFLCFWNLVCLCITVGFLLIEHWCERVRKDHLLFYRFDIQEGAEMTVTSWDQ